MNMDEDITEYSLSWQNVKSGPYTIKEIRSMLKRGTVHSLYKIQVGREWILLRDHLADLDQVARTLAKEEALKRNAQLNSTNHPALSSVSGMATDDNYIGSTAPPAASNTESTEFCETPANGIASTSFLLSLCFFIPFLNGITQLLSLIFGHLALAQMGPQHKGKSHTLATSGLWITYVQIGFMASSMTWLLLTRNFVFSLWYFILHFQMIGIALSALIGSGLLMLAIKLITKHLPTFQVCFIGTLLPSAVSTFGMLVIQSTMGSAASNGIQSLACIGLLQVLMFFFQMYFWSKFIKLPNGENIGLSSAALASSFYTIVFLFIFILYVMLIAALATSGFTN